LIFTSDAESQIYGHYNTEPPVPLNPSEYEIVVGVHGRHSQKVQFQWFLEAVIPNPVLRDIAG
jgi:hypothetical protein